MIQERPFAGGWLAVSTTTLQDLTELCAII